MDLGGDEMVETDPVEERPIAAGGLIFVVAALVWVGVSLAFDGEIAPLETLLFAVAFTAVYLAFSFYYPS